MHCVLKTGLFHSEHNRRLVVIFLLRANTSIAPELQGLTIGTWGLRG